jgi:hypothetical protein
MVRKERIEMSADEKQVGGDHYKTKGDSSCEHWNYVLANDLDYFQAQITKYVTRWKKKNGLVDLKKAMHFLEKYIEINDVTKDKYPDDYQEQLSAKMAKMRQDAMTGIPEHLREVADESTFSPMLRNVLEGMGEPLPNGYVNQDR